MAQHHLLQAGKSSKMRKLTSLLIGFAGVAFQAQASNAICYNCPPEWANWG
ncbi:ABC transporter substrate-binding protein, partial [Vibrio sp. 10N.222.49.E5]